MFADLREFIAGAELVIHNAPFDVAFLDAEIARLAENVGPVGRIFYSASTFICTPAAQAQPGGYALGAQVPDATLAELTASAGFGRFRRATETPFNRVFEVRP